MGKEKRNDLTLKIFALIIAIVLWSYVMGEVNPRISEEYRNVNVEFLNESALEREGLIILEPENASAKVSVSGRRSDIIGISKDDIIAQVDLSGYNEGEVKVPVYVQTPNEVTREDYSPREILFKFDKIINEERTVAVETEGDLASGYVLGTPNTRPQSIYIEGPRTMINSVSKAVASVDVSGSDSNINVTVPIKLVDNEGDDVRGISTNQNVVDVSIPVYQVKSVPIELQTENQLEENYEIVDININPSTVDIVGRENVLEGINSINTRQVDINSLIDGENIPIKLETPENVSLSNPNQEVTVTLTIEEVISKTLSYNLEDVEIVNLDPELNIEDADLEKPFILTIEGIGSVIDSLETDDMKIQLDLEDLDEGTHIVNVTVQEEEDIIVSSLLPEDFEITLIRE